MAKEKVETAEASTAVKRLDATLPLPLADYVDAVTGEGALYETPSEFIRDLVRRHMEQHLDDERQEIHDMLVQSMQDDNYAPWTDADVERLRKAARGGQSV